MVKVETRIQLAIKEILEEETWKHLKTYEDIRIKIKYLVGD